MCAPQLSRRSRAEHDSQNFSTWLGDWWPRDAVTWVSTRELSAQGSRLRRALFYWVIILIMWQGDAVRHDFVIFPVCDLPKPERSDDNSRKRTTTHDRNLSCRGCWQGDLCSLLLQCQMNDTCQIFLWTKNFLWYPSTVTTAIRLNKVPQCNVLITKVELLSALTACKWPDTLRAHH